MEDLFQPIIHVLGHPISANGILRRTVDEDIYLEVMRALDGIVSIPIDGCMMGHFGLQVVGKKKKMQKAWSMFKAGIVKENSMESFEAFP
ncbi:hypothetical protein SUGI_0173270 [Cryptomeria japonica]|nr:hypothetical protein SUGI_0173270 [Cryptomeria japonica]